MLLGRLRGIPSEYSINGKCGYQNKGLKCGGKWGICCDTKGECGSGDGFCGVGKCQSGNCTLVITSPPGIPDGVLTSAGARPAAPTPGGISTDSSCGGTNRYQCNRSSFRDCCSSSGFCGNMTEHCDIGCQANFGTCTKSIPPICHFDQAKGEYVCPKVSTDASCGGKQGCTCQESTFENCCSVQGLCGNTVNHCAQR